MPYEPQTVIERESAGLRRAAVSKKEDRHPLMKAARQAWNSARGKRDKAGRRGKSAEEVAALQVEENVRLAEMLPV
jgi:hypothetical protein